MFGPIKYTRNHDISQIGSCVVNGKRWDVSNMKLIFSYKDNVEYGFDPDSCHDVETYYNFLMSKNGGILEISFTQYERRIEEMTKEAFTKRYLWILEKVTKYDDIIILNNDVTDDIVTIPEG